MILFYSRNRSQPIAIGVFMIKGKNLKFFRHIATVLILILCAANTPLIVQPALATPIED